MDDQTNCYSNEQDGQNAIDPGHGVIGENTVQSTQAPAAGINGGTLSEQIVYFVMVDQFICECKSVGQHAEHKCRKEGETMFLQEVQKGFQYPFG